MRSSRAISPIISMIIIIMVSAAVAAIVVAYMQGYLRFFTPRPRAFLHASRLTNTSIVVSNDGPATVYVVVGICASGATTNVTMYDLTANKGWVACSQASPCTLPPFHVAIFNSTSGCRLVEVVTKYGLHVGVS